MRLCCWTTELLSYLFHVEEDDGLEDDDLALLEENTGTSFKRRGRLTRLRRGRDSESPPAASTSKRRAVIDSSDDDLDHDDLPRVQDIHNIWDDDGGRGDEDDIDSFIESDDEEGGAVLDEKAREERRREKKKQDVERRRTQKAHPELAGIDAKYVTMIDPFTALTSIKRLG